MSTFQIKPFPRIAVYPTSWAGAMTFDQIYDDLAHYASTVMKRYGVLADELPDCLQIGFMVLWETLSVQRDFLAEKTRRQAVFFVLARCKISTMRYQAERYDSLEALVTNDWNRTADEQIDGMRHQRDERWAGWATDIDIRIDVEQIMRKLAEKYADSFKHLVALYAVTTQVTRKDAAALAGMTPWNWHNTYEEPMLQEVRYEFAQVFLEDHGYTLPEPPAPQPNRSPRTGCFTSPYREWRELYRSSNTAPADALLAKYSHTPCLKLALQAQIDGRTYQQAADHYGHSANAFRKHMKRASKLLKEAYAT